jgi:hypothetical protein
MSEPSHIQAQANTTLFSGTAFHFIDILIQFSPAVVRPNTCVIDFFSSRRSRTVTDQGQVILGELRG